MDDLNVLARDLGYRPQGKSAPMRSDSATDSRPSAVQSSSTPLFNDVYGGSPTFMNKSKNNHKNISNQTSSSMNDFNINSKNSKNSSGPVYDDDIFEGLPGLKSKSVSSSTTKGMRFEGNVSSSMATPTKHNQRINDHFDDLLGDLGSKTEAKGGKNMNMNSSSARGFDDLLGGFGSRSPASSRTNPDSHSPLKPDPFVVLDSTSKDPLDELSHIGKSESSKVNDNLDPLHVFGKSTSPSSMGQGTKTSSNKEHSENFEESPTSPGYLNKKFEEKISPKSRVGEIWLSVSEIPLFTTPTKAPPPSRPPPPIPRKTPKSHGGGFFSERFRRKDSPSSSPKTVKTPKASHFNENIVNQNTSKQMDDMKEAMNRAESKFKHAKEVRDIEKEKEEEEKEKRRVERERERAKQAVERATREARERAAEKAQAERAAVHQAQAEARRRAERAAANKAAAEARERAATEARNKARMNQQKTDNDLESFFTSRPSSVPKTRPTNSSDHLFTSQSQSQRSDSAKRSGSSNVNSPNMKKMPSTSNIVDDLSSIFGGPSSSGDFQEVEGETEERRRARLERHQRTQERAAKALAEKYQRDLQAQRDQEERSRIGESIDMDIKRWAAGKEGNLRALLSTLQYVLWPECGWQAVSLTDLITGASVKKMYRKATLCIHPDKVQQKGATLQQKYVAEKVFDLLKEAWNKFNSEELF